MGCNSCRFLNENKKKEGACGGACYYCSKLKAYINGAYNQSCEDYKYDYAKKNYQKDEIYKDGRNYSSDNTDIGTYIFILVIIVILDIIFNFIFPI